MHLEGPTGHPAFVGDQGIHSHIRGVGQRGRRRSRARISPSSRRRHDVDIIGRHSHGGQARKHTLQLRGAQAIGRGTAARPTSRLRGLACSLQTGGNATEAGAGSNIEIVIPVRSEVASRTQRRARSITLAAEVPSTRAEHEGRLHPGGHQQVGDGVPACDGHPEASREGARGRARIRSEGKVRATGAAGQV